MNNYINLSNKWRPQIFEEVVGQKYIVLALINSLKQKKIYPCYLFYGPRGTGKTTLARILSKSLLCIKKITFRPCNKCFNCIQINNNNFLDFIEVNGALNTRLEDIKELIETANYMPSKARYRIYLIDEVHMLSKYSFNALLKILEEPPIHIKFILATTNIDKIPETIISRCLQFYLNPINNKELYKRLKYILNYENIIFKKKILNYIVNISNGSLRDGLTLLDYYLLINKNKVLNNNNFIKHYTGEYYQPYCFLFLKYIFTNNIKSLLNLIHKMYELNIINWNKIIDFLLLIIHNFMIKKLNYNIKNNLNKLINKQQKKFITNILDKISINNIIICYKKLIKCKKQYNLFNKNRIILEFNFIQIILKIYPIIL